MKKLFAIALLVASCASVRPAFAAVTADVTLAEDGNRLWAHARVHGIEKGQTLTVTFRWTAPVVEYTTKKGEKVRLFADSTCTPHALGDKDGGCFCTDTHEKGCQRTNAYRTLVTSLSNGKEVHAVGEWKCELLDASGAVIGSATYAVK